MGNIREAYKETLIRLMKEINVGVAQAFFDLLFL